MSEQPSLTMYSGNTSYLSPVAMTEWANAAQPGDKCVYAVGFAAIDAARPGGVLLIETMKLARKLWKEDKVKLLQKKVHEQTYEYIAVRNKGDEF